MADWKGTIEDRRNAMTTGLTGLPITQDRARELARLIAGSLEADGLEPLMELLLGVAPHWTNKGEITSDLVSLESDLWTRYNSAIEAVSTLYTYSTEFREQVEAYILRLRPTLDPLDEIELTGKNAVKKVKAGEQGRAKR